MLTSQYASPPGNTKHAAYQVTDVEKILSENRLTGSELSLQNDKAAVHITAESALPDISGGKG